MTLTEFLLARIAEDEQVLDVADSVNHYRFGSVRLQRECEAKRRIVNIASSTDSAEIHTDAWTVIKWTLRLLASVYADHPDYDEAWRP